jgi:hypothetical protein
MATFTYQDFLKMMAEPEKCLTASQELKHFNIIPEYHSLRQIEEKTSFELARMNILQYIITCVKNDPINGDYYNKENGNLIIEAGKLLNKTNDMRDLLVWSFIPNRYHREIDNYWDGIGNWMS